MAENLPDWLLPPRFDDPDLARVAAALHWVLVICITGGVVFHAVALAFAPHHMGLASVAGVAVLVVAFVLARRRHVRVAAVLVTVGVFAAVCVDVALRRGFQAPAAMTYFNVLIMAAILLGVRGVLVFTALSVVAIGGLHRATTSGALPPPVEMDFTEATWTVILQIAVAGVLLGLAVAAQREAERVRARLEGRLQEAQRLESIGRLAGGIAHDFNNLLTVILGNSSLMLKRMAPGSGGREEVEEIVDVGNRAAGLTRQLLAFARQQVFERRVIDLNETVAGLRGLLTRLLGEHVELIVHADPGVHPVNADPTQMEQVIVNLAVNARDAMPDGGRLLIETGRVELDDSYARSHSEVEPGTYSMLAVTDTGAGMDEGTRQHVFEPFFTTKPMQRGTGLGLATVHGIVRQSGGHVFVYSEPGRGTTFKIYLPAAKDVPTKWVEEATAPSQTTGSILVVEDEERVRRVIVRVLERAGHDVVAARDGEEAIAKHRERDGDLDLLITDVVMPKAGGLELVERLRAVQPDLRVLLVSGYTENGLHQLEQLGDEVEFLPKPFGIDVLRDKVGELLARPARTPTTQPQPPPAAAGPSTPSTGSAT